LLFHYGKSQITKPKQISPGVPGETMTKMENHKSQIPKLKQISITEIQNPKCDFPGHLPFQILERRMKFPLQSWGFVTSRKRALILRKRKRSDSDKNTWVLDIPCLPREIFFFFNYTGGWILNNQIFYL